MKKEGKKVAKFSLPLNSHLSPGFFFSHHTEKGSRQWQIEMKRFLNQFNIFFSSFFLQTLNCA
jgi:hypothetical protein